MTMELENRQNSTYLLQFQSMINLAYLSMTDLENSDAPRKMPLHLSRRLMWTSNFILFDVIYAYFLGNCADFLMMDLLCYVTSINYWRDARYDWRRKLDMCVAMPLFVYHVTIACIELDHFQNVKWMYLSFASICAALFSVGIVTNDRKIGQITHSIMHLLGAISAAFLYHYVSQERYQIVQPLS